MDIFISVYQADGFSNTREREREREETYRQIKILTDIHTYWV